MNDIIKRTKPGQVCHNLKQKKSRPQNCADPQGPFHRNILHCQNKQDNKPCRVLSGLYAIDACHSQRNDQDKPFHLGIRGKNNLSQCQKERQKKPAFINRSICISKAFYYQHRRKISVKQYFLNRNSQRFLFLMNFIHICIPGISFKPFR